MATLGRAIAWRGAEFIPIQPGARHPLLERLCGPRQPRLVQSHADRRWGSCVKRVGHCGGGYPHPRVFRAKSAEVIETKGVDLCLGAKKCKRVCKNVKRKGIRVGEGGK